MCTGAVIEAAAAAGSKVSGSDIQKQFRNLVPSGSAPSIPEVPTSPATDELAKKRAEARRIRERASAGPGRQSTILSRGQNAAPDIRTTLGGR